MPDPVSATVGSAALGFVGSQQAARSQRRAAETSANAQLEAARMQAEASRFRPVGVTTGFGSTRYVMGPDGYLVEAGYDLRPDLLEQREQLMGLLPGQLSQALDQTGFYQDIGQQYAQMGQEVLGGIQLDPAQAAAARTARMQELLAPGRAIGEERLFSQLAAKGLTGIGADIGGGMPVNPIAAARAQEQAQIDRAIAAESYDVAQSDINRALARAGGLFGTAQGFQFDTLGRALAPYQSALGMAQNIEALGAGALDIGTALGSGERTAAQAAGRAMAQGMEGAALTRQQAANLAAQQQAAMLGGLGRRLETFDWSQLNQQQPMVQDTGFRFYNTPAPYQSTQQAFPARMPPPIGGGVTQGLFVGAR